MVKFAGFATRIKPTGFRTPAFAGGMAKGFMNARYQAEQNALEREKIEFDKKKIEEAAKNARDQVAAINQKTKLETFQPTNLQLLNPASDGVTQGDQGFYYEPKARTGESESSLAFRQLVAFESQLGAKDGEALKALYAKDPNSVIDYLNDRYIKASSFRKEQDDDEYTSGYLIRVNPLKQSGSKDLDKFKNIFSLTGDSFKNSVSSRNQQIFGEMLGEKYNLGSDQLKYFTRKEQIEGTDEFINKVYIYNKSDKTPKITKDFTQISAEQFQEIAAKGFMDGSFMTDSAFGQILSTVKATGTLGNIDTNTIQNGYILSNESDITGIEDMYNAVNTLYSGSDSVQKYVQASDVAFKVNGYTYDYTPNRNPYAKEESALAAAFSVFIGNPSSGTFNGLAGNAYKVSQEGNKYRFSLKHNDLKATDDEIELANLTISASDEGIANIDRLLDINSQIVALGGKNVRVGSYATSDIANFTQKYSEVLGNMRQLIFPDSSGTVASIEAAMAEFADKSAGVDSRTKTKLGSIQAAYAKNIKEIEDEFGGKQDDRSKAMYLLRSEAEGIKVRLAFKLASLVQGGGKGGGRTISNADFEVIFNSLYKSGTADGYEKNILRAMHELQRARVQGKIIRTYGGSGMHNDLLNVANAVLDAHYQRNNPEFSSQYDRNRNTRQRNVGAVPSQSWEFTYVGDVIKTINEEGATDITTGEAPTFESILGVSEAEFNSLIPQSASGFDNKEFVDNSKAIYNRIINHTYNEFKGQAENQAITKEEYISYMKDVGFNKPVQLNLINTVLDQNPDTFSFAEKKITNNEPMINNTKQMPNIQEISKETDQSLATTVIQQAPEIASSVASQIKSSVNIGDRINVIRSKLTYGGEFEGNANTEAYKVPGSGQAKRIFGKVFDAPTVKDERNKYLKAQNWFDSPKTNEYFRKNPDQLILAEQDPIGFYNGLADDVKKDHVTFIQEFFDDDKKKDE